MVKVIKVALNDHVYVCFSQSSDFIVKINLDRDNQNHPIH